MDLDRGSCKEGPVKRGHVMRIEESSKEGPIKARGLGTGKREPWRIRKGGWR